MKWHWAYIENIVLIVCATFLTWIFHNGWFLLMLLLANTLRSPKKEENGEKNIL